MTVFRSCSDTAPRVLFLLMHSHRISCVSLPQLQPHCTDGWQSSADAHLASLLCGRTRVTTRLCGPQRSPGRTVLALFCLPTEIRSLGICWLLSVSLYVSSKLHHHRFHGHVSMQALVPDLLAWGEQTQT